jgi:hypothetical protein
MVNWYQENLLAHSGESCSSSQQPVSDSCAQLYHHTHCSFKISPISALLMRKETNKFGDCGLYFWFSFMNYVFFHFLLVLGAYAHFNNCCNFIFSILVS